MIRSVNDLRIPNAESLTRWNDLQKWHQNIASISWLKYTSDNEYQQYKKTYQSNANNQLDTVNGTPLFTLGDIIHFNRLCGNLWNDRFLYLFCQVTYVKFTTLSTTTGNEKMKGSPRIYIYIYITLDLLSDQQYIILAAGRNVSCDQTHLFQILK